MEELKNEELKNVEDVGEILKILKILKGFTLRVIAYANDSEEFKNTIICHLESIEPKLSEAEKWISVEERLPEENIEVLGYIKYEYYDETEKCCDVVRLKQGKWDNFVYDNLDVTHWMPLPNPPKEL